MINFHLFVIVLHFFVVMVVVLLYLFVVVHADFVRFFVLDLSWSTGPVPPSALRLSPAPGHVSCMTERMDML